MEKCEFCDCDLGEFVQYQSYFFKCLSCKQTGPSTSFDSIKDQLTGIYEVFVTDEDLKDKKM
ncbi:MAG: hypothetical protein GY756_19695, partial [bacterium]|nr:hypothetical protein [bacterium]